MMDKTTLRSNLLQRWKVGSSEIEKSTYIRILDHILNEPCKNLQHLAFGSFIRIANQPKLSNESLLKLVFHLINIGKLLELKYEFIDSDENCHNLPIEAIKQAESDGFLYHPETGEEITSYSENVFMYFTPSELLIELNNSASNEIGGMF